MRRTFVILILFFQTNQLYGQLKMKKLADLPDKMYETSGLAFVGGKYFVTINDSGNKSEVFLLDVNGKHVETVNVKDTKNRDWEALACAPDGTLYIGDVGNNLNKREKLQIYVLPPGFENEKSVEPEKITFHYEDQEKFPPKKSEMNFDCEGFLYAKGSIYIFTKCRTKPFTGITYIYELPAKPGKQVAKKIGQLQLCGSGWRSCSVTGVDYNEEYNMIAVLTYSRLYIIRDFKGTEFWTGKMKSYQLPIVKQREAIYIKDDQTLYMTDEYKRGLGGGNFYKISIKK